MASDFGKLNYTNLDFEKIRDEFSKRMATEVGLDNFRESSIARTILDIIAAATDMNNYYIERRAQESFFDTAKLTSSVIGNSKMLGYSVRRAVPSTASLSLVIKGNSAFSGIAAGNTITIPKWTTLSYDGQEFVTKYAYTYTITSADVTNFVNPNYIKTINYSYIDDNNNYNAVYDTFSIPSSAIRYIDIIQGTFVTGTFGSDQSDQVFQVHKLEDDNGLAISNWFGTGDPTYADEDLDADNQYSWVGKGNTEAEAKSNLFYIDRRTLSRPDLFDYSTSASPRVCLVRTTNVGGVEVLFGDGTTSAYGFSEIGVQSNKSIFYKFFTTLGASANKTGVIGKKLDLATVNGVTSNISGITSNIKNYMDFVFYKNPSAGEDMESKESIALNAPAIFNSLDRLVSKNDYVTFMRSLYTDANRRVRNSIAWGEQEEIAFSGNIADYRFYNVVFFSVLSSLYNITNDPTQSSYALSPVLSGDDNISLAYLELEDDFALTPQGFTSASSYPELCWYNVFVGQSPRNEMVRAEEFRNVKGTSHPISRFYDEINKRSMCTTSHIYITPTVQRFKLMGTVKLKKIASAEYTRRTINNSIYSFLDTDNDFNKEVLLSNLIGIMEDNADVVNVPGVYFQPFTPDQYFTYYVSDESQETALIFRNAWGVSALTPVVAGQVSAFDPSYTPYVSNIVNAINNVMYELFQTEETTAAITQRSFFESVRGFLTYSGGWPTGFEDTISFRNILYMLNSDVNKYVCQNMVDSDGNITNYSLGSEIVQVDLSYLTYRY